MRQSVGFELTASDLLAAYRAHCWAHFRRPRFLVTYLIVAICYTALGWLFNERDTLSSLLADAMVALLLAAVVMCLILGLTFGLLPRRVRRVFAQQKSLHGPAEVEWDDEEIKLSGATGLSRFAWHDFVKWHESSSTILLYQSDAMFNLLPKRAFSPEQIDTIRAAVKANNVRTVAG